VNDNYAITGPDRDKVLRELELLRVAVDSEAQLWEARESVQISRAEAAEAEVERLKKENDRLREELVNAKEYKARFARIIEQRQNAIERDRDELRAEVERLREWQNPTIELLAGTADDPFRREECKIADIGVADRIFVIECPGIIARAESAEAEVERLRECMRSAGIDCVERCGDKHVSFFHREARELLAATEGGDDED
jgi:hypothetical protein